MWYMHAMEYYTALKKEETPSIWDSMEEPWEHCVKQNKPVTEGKILHDSIYMR